MRYENILSKIHLHKIFYTTIGGKELPKAADPFRLTPLATSPEAEGRQGTLRDRLLCLQWCMTQEKSSWQ